MAFACFAPVPSFSSFRPLVFPLFKSRPGRADVQVSSSGLSFGTLLVLMNQVRQPQAYKYRSWSMVARQPKAARVVQIQRLRLGVP